MKTVIVSAARAPIGSFQGALSSLTAPQLGAVVLREAVRRAGVEPAQVQQVIMGCVLSAGIGQSPARQAAIHAGLPKEVGALTINKVCSSGLKAVMLADQLIRAGDADIVVAGGMESMSNAPYLLPKGRSGYRLGDGQVVDSLIFDGLRDAFGGQHMGECGDACAEKYKMAREAQDAYAIESYRRAQRAIESGAFRDEIVAVSLPQKKGPALVVDTDEEPAKVKFDRVSTLTPVFSKQGTITAANASSISDGAAAVVVMSEAAASALNRKPLATIVAHAEASQEPEWFTTAPVKAVQGALKKSGLRTNDIDLFEINEAFAVVTMVAIKELGLDPQKVNVNGGAVALGHPLGATGARLLATLLFALQVRGGRRGLVSLCNGGGEATAIVIERV